MRVTSSILTAVAFLALFGSQAQADTSPGLYVGAGFGQADVAASVAATDTFSLAQYNGEFEAHRSAYKIIAGVRPISLVGAEITYFDFGRPDGTVFGQSASASMHGGAAFAMAYLPLPLPLLELYGKAGFARIQSNVSGFTQPFGVACPIGGCPSPLRYTYYHIDRTNTAFAAGAGAQIKLGSLGVRAEYERFNAAGEHPNLVSIVATLAVW